MSLGERRVLRFAFISSLPHYHDAVVIAPGPAQQVSAGRSLCGAEPQVIYPDSSCHFAGFMAPSVFSRGLFCVDDRADKRSAHCSSEL